MRINMKLTITTPSTTRTALPRRETRKDRVFMQSIPKKSGKKEERPAGIRRTHPAGREKAGYEGYLSM